MKTRSRNTFSLHFVFLKNNNTDTQPPSPPTNRVKLSQTSLFSVFINISLHSTCVLNTYLFTLSCYSFIILLGNKCHLEMAFWLKYQLKHEIRFYEHLLLIPQLEC